MPAARTDVKRWPAGKTRLLEVVGQAQIDETVASHLIVEVRFVHTEKRDCLMKHLNKNMNGDDPVFDRLPEDADLAAQYLLLYELSLPFGSDINDRIDIGKSAKRMVVATDNSWSQELRELDERARSGPGRMRLILRTKHRASASSSLTCRSAISTACWAARYPPWFSFRSY